MKQRAVASTYLVIQGAACLMWWVLLDRSEPFRDRFELLGDPRLLNAFRSPDLLLIFAASWIAAGLVTQRSRWALPATTLVLGAMVYATGLVIVLTDEAPWAAAGPAAMVVGCLGTIIAVALVATDHATASPGTA